MHKTFVLLVFLFCIATSSQGQGAFLKVSADVVYGKRPTAIGQSSPLSNFYKSSIGANFGLSVLFAQNTEFGIGLFFNELQIDKEKQAQSIQNQVLLPGNIYQYSAGNSSGYFDFHLQLAQHFSFGRNKLIPFLRVGLVNGYSYGKVEIVQKKYGEHFYLKESWETSSDEAPVFPLSFCIGAQYQYRLSDIVGLTFGLQYDFNRVTVYNKYNSVDFYNKKVENLYETKQNISLIQASLGICIYKPLSSKASPKTKNAQ